MARYLLSLISRRGRGMLSKIMADGERLAAGIDALQPLSRVD